MVQYQKKPTKHARCGATGVILHGVSSCLRHPLGQFAGASAAARAAAATAKAQHSTLTAAAGDSTAQFTSVLQS